MPLPSVAPFPELSPSKWLAEVPLERQRIAALVIEDSVDLAANIADYLEAKGYLVDVAMDGVTGLHLLVNTHFDVVVLDLMLPGIDGLTLCKRLREEARKTIPVLMLTARGTLDDKAQGFAAGADDYLVKPFELRELDLRLRALVRRTRTTQVTQKYSVGDLTLDLATYEVTRAGEVLVLPVLPLKILEWLMARSPAVVSRREMEQAVWGDSPPESDALRVHMHTLRRAIDRPGQVPLLHTLRGLGYQIKAPAAASR